MNIFSPASRQTGAVVPPGTPDAAIPRNSDEYDPQRADLIATVLQQQEGLLSAIQRAEKAKQGFVKQKEQNVLLLEYLDNLKSATDI